MSTDVTILSGISRTAVASGLATQVSAKVIPINEKVSEQLSQQEYRAAEIVKVEKAANQINEFVKQIGRNLEFSVDESSGRIIITVRESETGKIVRQIPPEELLVIAALVREHFAVAPAPTGILLADKV